MSESSAHLKLLIIFFQHCLNNRHKNLSVCSIQEYYHKLKGRDHDPILCAGNYDKKFAGNYDKNFFGRISLRQAVLFLSVKTIKHGKKPLILLSQETDGTAWWYINTSTNVALFK